MKLELLTGLQQALEYAGGTHTLRDVAEQIRAGDAQIWVDEDAVIVTEIHQTPRMKVCHFWLASGQMDAVVELSHHVLEWAHGVGCTRATLSGRRGWERALAAEGWSLATVVLQREVTGE